jgi:hypothetical protein
MSTTQATLLLFAPIVMLIGGLAMFYCSHDNKKGRVDAKASLKRLADDSHEA